MHREFEALVATQPDAIAVVCETSTSERAGALASSITYAELEGRSNQLAHTLIDLGVGPERFVGVCLPPSFELPVALLAIFKAGGVYFPIDPTHPPAFIARTVDQANPTVILTLESLRGVLPTGKIHLVCMDATPATSSDNVYQTKAPALDLRLDRAATLLFTSGTTGKPKGVVATHENLVHYMRVARESYRFGPADVFCCLARNTFSISLFELLSPLCCGARVWIVPRNTVLAPDQLACLLGEVTVVHAGPSLLGNLFRYLHTHSHTFPNLRHASTGGDIVPRSILQDMKRVFSSAENYVIYGCTEVSCMGTTYPVQRAIDVSLVGKPFSGVTLRVLDSQKLEVAPGEIGEIHVSGAGVVRGYLNQPELTSERFVQCDGQMNYATGDLGRLDMDGNLEFLGRNDFQVQIRGVRIELAGIENVIRELGLAAECVVIGKRLNDEVRLVAYVTNPVDSNLAQFRRALGTQLPDVMLPRHLVVLDKIPLTPNGKVDRKALQQLPLDHNRLFGVTTGSTTLISPQEQQILGVFSRILGLAHVGLDDNFFELGGHSLLAVIATQDLEHTLGTTLSPGCLFEYPTARLIAAQLSRATVGATDNPVDYKSSPVPPFRLNTEVIGPPLFVLSGVHGYQQLATQLDGKCTVFGVFAACELTQLGSDDLRSVQSLAKTYIQSIRSIQPRGPYRLLGNSFAGFVAYEVAQQLSAVGEEIQLLALIDSQLPEWALGWKSQRTQLKRLSKVPLGKLFAFAVQSIQSTFKELVRNVQEPDPRLSQLDAFRAALKDQAANEYAAKIRPYNGDLLLFSSAKRIRSNPANSPDCGWRTYAKNLHIEMLEAEHVAILGEVEHVSHVAQVLLASMSKG